RWNPVRDMITLREAMDRLADENFRPRNGSQNVAWALPVDAYVNQDSIIIEADVPGVKPEDLDVTLEGDTLTIRGEVKGHGQDQKFLLHERPTGRFERTLTINTPIDNGKVEAHFENGVVQIVLPKAEAVKPKQIKVNGPKTAQPNGNK